MNTTQTTPEHVWSAFIWVRATCNACGETRTVRAESKRLHWVNVLGKLVAEFETSPMGAQKWHAVTPCPCGASRDKLREIHAHVDAGIACNGSCHSAKGADCFCSCGGRNHGVRAK